MVNLNVETATEFVARNVQEKSEFVIMASHWIPMLPSTAADSHRLLVEETLRRGYTTMDLFTEMRENTQTWRHPSHVQHLLYVASMNRSQGCELGRHFFQRIIVVNDAQGVSVVDSLNGETVWTADKPIRAEGDRVGMASDFLRAIDSLRDQSIRTADGVASCERAMLTVRINNQYIHEPSNVLDFGNGADAHNDTRNSA